MTDIAAHAPKALVCWKMEKLAQIIQMVRLTTYTSIYVNGIRRQQFDDRLRGWLVKIIHINRNYYPWKYPAPLLSI